MTRLKDIIGKKFNMLTVIRSVGFKKYGCFFLCQCDCGKQKEIQGSLVKRGRVVSCGCLAAEKASQRHFKHGASGTKLYKVWKGMIERCYVPKCKNFKNYGGRGILVCDRWKNSFVSFKEDVIEGYSEGLELDRIRNDEGYHQGNFRWVTHKANNNNKRTNCYVEYKGEIKTASEWAEIYDLNSRCISNRVRDGFTGEEAIFGVLFLRRQRKISM